MYDVLFQRYKLQKSVYKHEFQLSLAPLKAKHISTAKPMTNTMGQVVLS